MRTDVAAAGRPHEFVAAGGHPGHLLELGAEMRHAGVAEPEGDLAERELVVDEQFLHTFDLLGDEILLYGPALGFGKERTDLPVIDPQAFLQVFREAHVGHHLLRADEFDHGPLDGLDHPGTAIFEEFELVYER